MNLIKFTQGWISDNKGTQKPIVVKTNAPNKLRDAMIGGVITTVGIVYLTVTAFKNGAEAFDEAEFETLDSLGLIHPSGENCEVVEDTTRDRGIT